MPDAAIAVLRDNSAIEGLASTFANGLLAVDLAQPLLSLDGSQHTTSAARLMRDQDIPVLGVRVEGRMAGWVVPADLAHEGELAAAARSFLPEYCLHEKASIQDVLTSVAGKDQVFLRWLGEPVAVITRADLQKPAVRMWLFGVVTLLDANLTWAVEALYPEEAWTKLISEGRRSKALALREERRRRGSHARLVDCLQIKDKADILTKDPAHLSLLGFKSRREADRATADLELLRNHLAHGQEFEDSHLGTASRLAASLEKILRADLASKLVGRKRHAATTSSS